MVSETTPYQKMQVAVGILQLVLVERISDGLPLCI